MNLKFKPLIAALALTSVPMFGAEGVVVPKASDSITIKGDLRVRHENRKRNYKDPLKNDDSRNRLRTRFRLGFDFKTAHGWSAHAGLATGGGDGTSTNDTWNEGYVWETGAINLDYAYVKHAFESDTTIMVGQQKNPFIGAGIFWDSDLRPTGFIAQQAIGPAFITGGYYNLGYFGDSGLGEMLAVQAGVKTEGDVSFTGAISYYLPNNKFNEETFGNTTRYEFEFVNLYGDVSFKAGAAAIKVFAEAGQNLGADSKSVDVGGDTQLGGSAPIGYSADDNNSHYTIGAEVKAAGFKVKAQYAKIEGDSTLGGFDMNSDGDIEGTSNSDFGTGIGVDDLNADVKGIILGASYGITKNCSIGVTFMDYEVIERRPDKDGQLVQIDLKYKF